MICDLRSTIEDLKTHRAVVSAAIELLEELNGGGKTGLQINGRSPLLDEWAAQAARDAAILRNKAKAQKAAGKKRKKMPKTIQTSDGQKLRRGRKNPFSPYEGVYNGGVNAQGRQRYIGSVRQDGKNKGLGTFFILEEAAAAVQKAKGNKAEAKRLLDIAKQKAADMLEQAENNPNREPPGRRRKSRKTAIRPTDPAEPSESELASLGGLPPAGHIAMVWVCNKCGHQHLQAERPKVCENCLNDHSFHPIK